LLDDATPPRPLAGIDRDDALLDPGALGRVEPVTRPRAGPAGLERAGVGLPVVARLPAPRDPNAPRAGYHLRATLVALPGDPHPRKGRAAPAQQPAAAAPALTPGRTTRSRAGPAGCCEAALLDPDQIEEVPTAAGTLPVAMDLHAPLLATKAAGIRPLDGLANLVRPGRFSGEPRIVFLQPFDPDKTPLVLVHGLLSTPGIWRPLVIQLLADPRIRDCCQLWFFYYPTGQPVPLSALQLRDALDDAVRDTGLNRKMILIGHSMGGILSRAQVSRLSPARVEQIVPGVSELSEYNRARRALTFEPRSDVSRVVFLFVPHRGSRLASNSLGALVIRLIRLPDTLLNEAEYALDRLAGLDSRRLPTSIHGLSPRSPFLRALSSTTPTVPVHSIIGNRGRGDGSAGSDGVVPVRSARVASAESELLVPTGHGGFDHPAAVAEIKRVVLMDVAQRQAGGDAPAHSLAEPRQVGHTALPQPNRAKSGSGSGSGSGSVLDSNRLGDNK
jgi:pimeloyl-ACP methyl ester carboxylesterase